MNKTEFRKKMMTIRDDILEEVKAIAPRKCMGLLRNLEEYQKAELIYTFVSFGSEINTQEMISEILKDGKRVAVPKVSGKEMVFKEIDSLNLCIPGAWGILEPKEELPTIQEKGIILMPGLGFDKKGSRIGYGGGYYDRYLEKHTDLLRIGLAYDEQLTEDIPCEAHDIIVNYLLTPSKLRKIC